LQLTGFFVEVDGRRIDLPPELAVKSETRLADGRLVKLSTKRDGDNFTVSLTAQPTDGVSKWGLAIEAGSQEYFSGVMERVIDGPQQLSWEAGQDHVLNLRGQKVDVILKPTTSDRKSTRLNSSHVAISYAVFCLKKKNITNMSITCAL